MIENDITEQEILNELNSVLVNEQPDAINNARYELIIDGGKPFTEKYNTLDEVKQGLTKAYQDYQDMDLPYLDIKVFDGETDISESQFITEMISEIMGDDDQTEEAEDLAYNEENIPCKSCGKKDKPLFTDYLCPDCHHLKEIEPEEPEGLTEMPEESKTQALTEALTEVKKIEESKYNPAEINDNPLESMIEFEERHITEVD